MHVTVLYKKLRSRDSTLKIVWYLDLRPRIKDFLARVTRVDIILNKGITNKIKVY
jgi:hypothetical protein